MSSKGKQAPEAPPVKNPEPPRPGPGDTDQRLLWCPFAERAPAMRARGEYPKQYPEGAIVHYTSGSSAESSLSWGRGEGYMFWMIARDGKIYQPNPLNEWGYHAGESSYPGLGTSVSDQLVGIEIDNGSELIKKADGNYYTWFGRKVPMSNVRISRADKNIKAGAYEKFTSEQEASLFAVLLWLKRNNPNVFRLEWVLGHDEVAPSRKSDPGGALSMTMPELRLKLINEWKGT